MEYLILIISKINRYNKNSENKIFIGINRIHPYTLSVIS